jgi:tetratricopeptide (TPR) repeat protein
MAFAEVTTTIRMMREERGASAIKDVIAALRATDGDMDQALRRAWGSSLAELEERARANARALPLERVPGLVAFDGELEAPARLEFSDEGAPAPDPEKEADALRDRQARDWTVLGDRLKGRRYFDAALIEYDKALAKIGHGDPIIANKKAHALLLAGRPGQAREVLEDSLRWNPAMAVTLENLAEAHLRLAQDAKDPAVAAEHERLALERAIEAERVNPFSVDTHVRLAALHEKLGNRDAARLARERIALLREL